MTDIREQLDHIKKNLRDADRDAFMGNLSHQARTEIPRLTEALEAVLGAHESFELSWGYGPVEFCKQCSNQGVPQEQAEWPCPTVKAIEAKLSEEED